MGALQAQPLGQGKVCWLDFTNIKRQLGCEIEDLVEDLVETHLQAACDTRPRVPRDVYVLMKDECRCLLHSWSCSVFLSCPGLYCGLLWCCSFYVFLAVLNSFYFMQYVNVVILVLYFSVVF